jgi:uncharacterized protein YegL
MADTKGHLLPIYVLVDESYSMRNYVGQLNDGIVSLYEELRADPMTAAKIRLSVLGFSGEVIPRLALADLRKIKEPPKMATRTTTNYHAVFTDLLTRIPDDVASLKQDGYLVHRPAVFFMSDGQPNDDNEAKNEDWMAARRRLTDKNHIRAAPNIIAFGMGEVWAQTIVFVATRPEFAYVAAEGSDVGASITKFFVALTASVVQSGQSLNSASPELVVEKPEGFRMAIDLV